MNIFEDIAPVKKQVYAEPKADYRSSQASLMRKKRAEERDISDIPDKLDPLRWESCRFDLKLFLETYLPEQFCMEWSDAHLRCLEKMQYAILTGGYFALAMPRGEGKTTICKGAALWALLYGHKRYVVLIAATERKARQLLKSMKQILRFNTLLLEDFPEVVVPVRDLEGKASRCASQTIKGEPSCMVWTTDEVVLPRVDGSLCCESRIEVAGITGEIRGRNATLADGSEIRPDLAVPDDPQTHASAKSPTQCDDREEIIRTDVLGLAGPGEKLSVFIPCTVIKKDDLADRLLDNELNPDFRGEKTAAILSWPKNLERDDGKDGKTTWADYNDVRIEGLHNEDEGRAANKFYKRHREDLEEGAKVGWQGRKHESDASALQSIMNQYYAMGKEAFYSEYQNDPIVDDESIYDLSPELVASRLNGFKRLQVPEEATMLVSMADINYVGLNVTVCAFKNDFTGWIVDHFKFPPGKQVLIKKNTSESEAAKIVARAVIEVEKLLDTKGYTQNGELFDIDRKLFDANFWTKHVYAAIKSIRKKSVLPDRGTAATKYRVPRDRKKLIGKPFNQAHLERGPLGVHLRHESDYWRMVTQKAFLLRPGVSGSLSLWGDDPAVHRDYAHEVCGEKLINFVPAEPNDMYQWHQIPGQANDQLDSTVGCLAGASSLGASLDGVNRRRKRPKPKAPPQPTNRKKPKGGIRTKY